MRLGGRRPGLGTSFIDSASEDLLLQVKTTDEGETQVSYRLRDSSGNLVADSGGSQVFPAGVEVRDAQDEVLLYVPPGDEDPIIYRLYGYTGRLLTCSDGLRTQLFAGIRVEPAKAPKPPEFPRNFARTRRKVEAEKP